jgi:hypothetical protein
MCESPGFSFFQFCDVKNLEIFPERRKSIEFMLDKQTFPKFFVKKTTNFVEEKNCA